MSKKEHYKFRWALLLPWVEPFVSLVVGLILFFPLQRRDLAEVAWIIGVLFSLNNVSTVSRLKDEFELTRKLSEIVDLDHRSDVAGINEILRLYLSIPESEFRYLKDQFVAECAEQLSILAHEKAIEASGGGYHQWLLDMLRTTSQNEQVRAISVMAESSWVDIPAEKGYLKANIDAASHGVKVERIFVTSKARLMTPENREAIYLHMAHSQNGMTAYIAWLDELQVHDPLLIDDVGEGFVLFGERVALIDITVPPDQARGRVTMNPTDLARCLRLFDRLRLHARLATDELFQELGSNLP